MKYIIIWFLIPTLLFTGCNNSSTVPDMSGTYLMRSQTLNNGAKDTKYTDIKQLKVYTADSFFMFAQVNQHDTISGFGVGSYTSEPGFVNENVIFSGSGGVVNAPAAYKVAITREPDGYMQVIPQIKIQGENYKLTEEYLTVGTKTKGPLDGIWKQTKFFSVKGSDTTPVLNRTQYKTFYDGYFMFGYSDKDSSAKIHTGMGFGTYEMKGDNQFKETDLNSSYSVIDGRSFDINIEMDGADHYKQTITDTSGTKSVEVYERLKK